MNVRPAPFHLTPATIEQLLDGARPASRVIRVPLLPIKLVDRPRRSADPRLAKANDDFVGKDI